MARKDLIPLNKRTKEEVKKIASNGGKKSGEARRSKRDLKERFKLGLEVFAEMKAKQFKEAGRIEEAKLVKEMGLEVYSLLEIASDDSVLMDKRTKLAAINDIMDRTEGKPIQKSVLDANIGEKELSEKEQELINRHLSKEVKKLKDK